MSQTVKLSKKITAEAKLIAQVFNRSQAGQIEYWAKIGMIAEQNPDFSYNLIKEILIAKQEVETGYLSDYDLNN